MSLGYILVYLLKRKNKVIIFQIKISLIWPVALTIRTGFANYIIW